MDPATSGSRTILGSSITELAGSAASSPGQILSPTAGWARDAGLTAGLAVAIDASGNLWVTNFYTNTLTEIVGLATPVKTPSGRPGAVALGLPAVSDPPDSALIIQFLVLLRYNHLDSAGFVLCPIFAFGRKAQIPSDFAWFHACVDPRFTGEKISI